MVPKNRKAIDDPKTVGLWCMEYYHGYSGTFPPEETDNGTDYRWKWLPNNKEHLWTEPDIEELNFYKLWFAPRDTNCFLANKYISIC
jgi:hypothetical protein